MVEKVVNIGKIMQKRSGLTTFRFVEVKMAGIGAGLFAKGFVCRPLQGAFIVCEKADALSSYMLKPWSNLIASLRRE
jgi:hypothetical protein